MEGKMSATNSVQSIRRSGNHYSPSEADFSLRDALKSRHINLMLRCEDARAEALRRVVRLHRYGFSAREFSPIVFRIHQMNRDPGLLVARREHGLVHAATVHSLAAEFRQQCGMNVATTLPRYRRKRLMPELLHVPASTIRFTRCFTSTSKIRFIEADLGRDEYAS